MPDTPPASPTGDTLSALPPPPRVSAEAAPEAIAAYVRAAMQRDRTPGHVVVVAHPKRLPRVPRGLFDALRATGCTLEEVHTQADRHASVMGIAEALRRGAAGDRPLDVIVIAGDGTLDHHVLTAAYVAFYPDLAQYRPGTLDVSQVTPEHLSRAPRSWRRAFLDPLPTTDTLTPDEATVQQLWVLRSQIERNLSAGDHPERVCAQAGRSARDPLLRLAVLATLAPRAVVVRSHGFDLEGLSRATQESSFQGLYAHIRAISVIPAGTASDNALYAGVPGWGYAQAMRLLGRWAFLDPLRRRWEQRLTRRFVDYFTRHGVTVPARFSVVSFDGAWQALCSHAVGGPGSGALFAADLVAKSGGLLGYLARLPGTVLREGVFGSTVVQLSVKNAEGRVLAAIRSQLAEALYTNRTFISGVGAIPSTDPTSFAGRSTFLVAPPILARDEQGAWQLRLRGLGALLEAIVKGITGRVLHLIGIDPGRLAGGGRLVSVLPEHQLTLREGDQVDVTFHTRDGHARAVPTQVSGDPFQAAVMSIRVAWGPIPVLAAETSLLLAAVRRGLDHLRVRQTWHLDTVNIGGLAWYRQDSGTRWSPAFSEQTGLPEPLLHLRLPLAAAQRRLIDSWARLQPEPFVDTSAPGIQLGRRGRYAHTSDHRAHLVVLRTSRTTLLVRQIQASEDGHLLHETHATYAAFGPVFVLRTSQTRVWRDRQAPTILQESQIYRSADAVLRDAPAFFPFGREPAPSDD